MLEKIKALKEKYVLSLRPDLDILDALASELNFGLEEDRTFAELHALAHRHAGSAGSFGLHDLGNCARDVDQLLQTDTQDPTKVLPLIHDWQAQLASITR